jgi:proteasome lid subunit RPN8/RPN11
MRLTREQLEQLIAQAQQDAPNETCGIIGGKERRAVKIFPLKNVDGEPRIRYNCEPQQLLQAMREIEDGGWEHLAIYHSHPASPAYPSATDIARAFYPDAVYLLISLMNPEQAALRGFRIVEGKVEEITLEIEDEAESARVPRRSKQKKEVQHARKNAVQRTNSRRPARRTGRSRAGRAVAPLSKRRPARGGTRRARR